MPDYLTKLSFAAAEVTNLTSLGEYKGKEALYSKQTPDTLEKLLESAIIESAESSNRIEGIIASPGRVEKIIRSNAAPQGRSEQEIAGYRDVLNLIHQSNQDIPLNENVILQFHSMLFRYTTKKSGLWKTAENNIVEKYPDDVKKQVFELLVSRFLGEPISFNPNIENEIPAPPEHKAAPKKKAAAKAKRIDVDIDQLLMAESELRESKKKLQDIVTEKNRLGKSIPKLSEGDKKDAIAKLAELKEQEAGINEDVKKLIKGLESYQKIFWPREPKQDQDIIAANAERLNKNQTELMKQRLAYGKNVFRQESKAVNSLVTNFAELEVEVAAKKLIYRILYEIAEARKLSFDEFVSELQATGDIVSEIIKEIEFRFSGTIPLVGKGAVEWLEGRIGKIQEAIDRVTGMLEGDVDQVSMVRLYALDEPESVQEKVNAANRRIAKAITATKLTP